MTALKVYGFFFKIVFLNFFSKSTSRTITLDTLFNAHSYRIPNTLNKYKAPIVYFFQSYKKLFSKNTSLYDLKPLEKAVYCIRPYHATFCLKYMQELGMNVNEVNVIVRDESNVGHLTSIDKMIVLICNFFLCIFCLFLAVFMKNANKLSILSLELTESSILMSNLLKCKTSYVYFFSAYEKDANFIALLMQKSHVLCHKIPSSNPIKNFYPKVIADKFSFTAPFQINEYPSLKSNWLVAEFDMYPNLGFQNLVDFTIEKKGEAPKNSIGIFTRGIWLRKLRGDSFLGVGEDIAEIEMLNYLKEFLLDNPYINTVYILLHPTEKKTIEQFEQSKKYYMDFFGVLDLNFVDSTVPSNELFGLFDVGIASVSSVIFERLYCGYKCLLAPINLKVKLFEDENLNHIIANSKEEFFIKLKEITSISNMNYFSEYNLNDYRLNTIQKITF